MSPYRDVGKARSDVSARPQDGDVMITRETRPSTRYTVRQLPDNGQLTASSRDDAVLLARGFAQARGVNFWYCDDTTLRLLEAYRPPQTPEPLTNIPELK